MYETEYNNKEMSSDTQTYKSLNSGPTYTFERKTNKYLNELKKKK